MNKELRIEMLEYEIEQRKTIRECANLMRFGMNGEVVTEGASDVLNAIVGKIRKVFNTIRTKLTDFFTGKVFKEKHDKLSKAVKDNPEIGKKKIKIRDVKALERLNDEHINRLTKAKSKEECDRIDADCKAKRNKIIAAGTVVTVASALAIMGAIYHNKMSKSKKDEKEIADFVSKLTFSKNDYKDPTVPEDVKFSRGVVDSFYTPVGPNPQSYDAMVASVLKFNMESYGDDLKLPEEVFSAVNQFISNNAK